MFLRRLGCPTCQQTHSLVQVDRTYLETGKLEIIVQFELGLRVSFSRREVDYQAVLHCKRNIVVNVLRSSVEDLGDYRLVPLGGDYVVDMRRAPPR